MKYGVIIAARTSSTRLPGKALMTLKDLPMVVFLIRRLHNNSRSGLLHFATTDLPDDDWLASVVEAEGVPVFRGSNEDVMQRYVDAAQQFGIECVIRITADCPFVDAETLDYCLDRCETFGEFDLATTKGLFPVGIDFEIYNASSMRALHESGLPDASDREHLTKYFYDHPDRYDIRRIEPDPAWVCTTRAFTVDTEADYAWAQQAADRFDTIRFRVSDLIRNECK